MNNSKLVPPGLTLLANNVVSSDNILGASKKSGAAWAAGLGLPRRGETVFFAGCGYQFSGELESLMSVLRKIDESAISTEMAVNMANLQKKLGIDTAGILRRVMGKRKEADSPLADAVSVLKRLRIDLAYLAEDEPCCGGILHFAGLSQEFKQQATAVTDRLVKAGVKEIISIVPSCTYTLRNLIPAAVGSDKFTVRHFCQVVADNLASLELTFPRPVRVTYHDPCQLVRYLGLVEEPRKILSSVKNLEFLEAGWTSREYATCCGGGGGFEAVFPEMSQMLAVNRVKELLETGAEIIVTHCPGCILQLQAGLEKLKVNNVEVLDLAQVVARSLVK